MRSRTPFAPRWLLLACAMLVGSLGCASARLPLCPSLATASYPSPAPDALVNQYMAVEAKRSEIRIDVLSPFTAAFSGEARSLSRFRANYPFMVCAFDPQNVILDEQTYLVCMSHAREWIDIVQSAHPENLMLKETHYADVCVR